jgi:hypothetical protein
MSPRLKTGDNPVTALARSGAKKNLFACQAASARRSILPSLALQRRFQNSGKPWMGS